MTAASRKIVRDFWKERTRAALVVLAIALGITGFSAVMSSYAVLTRELDKGYLATNPASATFHTDRIDDDLVRSVLANSAVAEAEPRRVVSGRIKVGPIEWRNLVLFAVKDYGNIRVSRLEPQQGAWPPARDEILIERDAFQVAHAKIGDTVSVRTTNGHEQALRVTGSVHDVGQAQARMENLVYGYITLDTLSDLGEQPYLDRLNILVSGDRFNESHIRSVADQVRRTIDAAGHPVRSFDIPTPGKHPHAELMGTMLLTMSTFGLLVLFLSGVIVVNLLTGLMASQVRQIGVMKAIGATRQQIARIYFGQALLLGLTALAIGVPLGELGNRALCRYLAVFLNFDITSFAVPAWVYLLDAAVGIAAPLLAAARPIARGTQVTVREALADFGVRAVEFGRTPLERRLLNVGDRFRPLVFAVRNSLRKRARLQSTVATLVFGGLFFMSALNVRSSMIATLDRLFSGRRYDLSVSVQGMVPWEKIESAIARTPGIKRSEGWIATEGSIPTGDAQPAPAPPAHKIGGAAQGLHGGGSTASSDKFPIFAIPPDTKMMAFEVTEGRALNADETDAIVVNNALARSGNFDVGKTVTLQIGPSVGPWRVVGRVRESFSPPVGYISRKLFDQMHPGMANNLRLILDKTDPDSMNRMKAALEENLQEEGVRATSSLARADSRKGFDEHMLMIYLFLIIMAGILAGVGGLGLSTTMSLNVMERRREMGVLRAIGATPRMLWLIVVTEGVAIGVMSWILATLLAWPISKIITSGLGMHVMRVRLDFSFETVGIFVWLGISLILGSLASFVPAWQASRRPVREAVAYE